MKRVIYSLYIDIPKSELDPQTPHHGETECKNQKAKREFKYHADWLKVTQERYASDIGVDYKFFHRDNAYDEYEKFFKENYPQITTYNIVNFYKIHLMYELAKEYDEILYLDLDVVPFTRENFFDVWDLSKGVAIMYNDISWKTCKSIEELLMYQRKIEQGSRMPSNRSPFAKYWNAKAMIIQEGIVHDIEDYEGSFNTGIVGINKETLEKLDYFGNFDHTIEVMDELRDPESSFYPEVITDVFGYDNETIWAYKTAENAVDFQILGKDWHHTVDKHNYIGTDTKLAHVINKNFEFVKSRYEAIDF